MLAKLIRTRLREQHVLIVVARVSDTTDRYQFKFSLYFEQNYSSLKRLTAYTECLRQSAVSYSFRDFLKRGQSFFFVFESRGFFIQGKPHKVSQTDDDEIRL